MSSGFFWCRNKLCWMCNKWAPESATVHRQCLASCVLGRPRTLSISQCLDQLRVIVLYRRPRPNASRIEGLTPHPLREDALTRRWVDRIPDTSDLSRLRYLPQELVNRIKQFSPGAWLWRLISILDLAKRTPLPRPGPVPYLSAVQAAVFIEQLASWARRDEKATRSTWSAVTSRENPWPVLRITIATEGIRVIERLPERPPAEFRSSASKHEVYVVEDVSELTHVAALIQVQLEMAFYWSYPQPVWFKRSLTSCL